MERVSKLTESASRVELVRAINKLIAAFNSGQRMIVGPGLEAYQGSGGTILSEMRHPLDIVRSAVKPPSEGGGNGTSSNTYFFARINSYTALPDVNGKHVNQWNYDFTEVVKLPSGYETPQYVSFRRMAQSQMLGMNWGAKTNGRGGTCYNFRENQNYVDGIQGNGIDLSNTDLPTGFAIQPCPVGEIVVMYQIATTEGNEYWFDYSNAYDGSCG
jgi:hypothetical protein